MVRPAFGRLDYEGCRTLLGNRVSPKLAHNTVLDVSAAY